jgi:hypothetical protein
LRRAGSSGRARTIRGRPALLGAVVTAVIVLAGSCASDGAGPAPTPTPTTATAPAPACVAPPGAALADVDPEALPEKPWRRPAGAEVRVVFETAGLAPRYRQMVDQGARTWSASPCVTAVTADRCAPGDNCVAVVERRDSGDDADGAFSGRDGDTYRRAGTITLYTAALDTESDEGALVAVVHEMGHALGLRHRTDPRSVMYPSSDESSGAAPDAVDLANLLALYG